VFELEKDGKICACQFVSRGQVNEKEGWARSDETKIVLSEHLLAAFRAAFEYRPCCQT
jgi:hypothetical protein